MKLSVIVPVYNMASDDRLSYTMDCLLHQTIRDFEIVAVDDCSTDASGQILQELQRQHPDLVKVYRTPRNLHQGGAKNLGLLHASGDFIAFIDADDWVVPDYFERLLNRAEATGADVVGTDYSLVYEHTMTPGRVVHNNQPSQAGVLDEDRLRSLMLDFGSLCVKIFRREIILDCPSRFPEGIFYEDNALARTWVSRMHRFEYIPEPLYFYYQHSDSTVHTVTRQRLEDRLTSARIMLEEARHYGYFDRFRPELEYSFLVLFYKNTLFSCMRQMREKGKYTFIRGLGREMSRTFPDFEKNPYYRERTNEEEQHFLHLCIHAPLRFYVSYQLLWWLRDHWYGKS